MNDRDTPPRLSHNDMRKAVKRLFAQACTVLAGVDYTTVARDCEVSASLAKKWGDTDQDYNPPLLVLARVARPVRAFLHAGLDALGPTDAGAPTPEAQSLVLTGTIGKLLVGISSGLAGDETYDRGEARSLLADAVKLRAQLDTLITLLRFRLGDEAEPSLRAVGGSAR
jgi:hypothetical protein